MKTESGFYLLFRCGFLALILISVAFFNSGNAADKPTFQGAVRRCGNRRWENRLCRL